jgi:L-gulonate 3-dehydrogenase
MLFAGAGYQVSLYDVSLDLVEKAIKDIDEQLQALEKSGMLRGTTTAAQQLVLVSGK